MVTVHQLRRLEERIKKNIATKSLSDNNEAAMLKKSCKYFDSDGSGHLNFSEFCKALERFGSVGTPEEMQALFNKFDSDGSGELTYDEFVNGFYGIPPRPRSAFTHRPPTVVPKPTVTSVAQLNEIEQRLRDSVERKCTGDENEHHVLKRAFKFYDIDNSGKISFSEFLKSLDRFGTVLQEYEAKALFQRFDVDGSGTLSYDEFINGLYHIPPKSVARPRTAVGGSGGRANASSCKTMFDDGVKEPVRVKAAKVAPPVSEARLTAAEQKLRSAILRAGAQGILRNNMQQFDLDKSGKISLNEFHLSLERFGNVITRAEATALFRKFDQDKSGELDYDEFARYLCGRRSAQEAASGGDPPTAPRRTPRRSI